MARMFTKKHYVLIARLIGESKTLDEFQDKIEQALERDADEFDLERFTEAVIKTRLEVVA